MHKIYILVINILITYTLKMYDSYKNKSYLFIPNKYKHF